LFAVVRYFAPDVGVKAEPSPEGCTMAKAVCKSQTQQAATWKT